MTRRPEDDDGPDPPRDPLMDVLDAYKARFGGTVTVWASLRRSNCNCRQQKTSFRRAVPPTPLGNACSVGGGAPA